MHPQKSPLVVDVIIPAFNEEDSIALVVNDIPKDLVRHIFVVNNNSTDATKERAILTPAIVLDENQRGYGSACLRGVEEIEKLSEAPDVVLFMDGDYSDFPEQSLLLLDKIKEGYDMVIGSRALGNREAKSMTIPQKYGNVIAAFLIKKIYQFTYTDLGPFRAIRYEALKELNMRDQDFGWTVEMQIKALKHKLKICEVPVDYRARIGVSKISGNFKGAILAGVKIIKTIWKYR